jgi:hypothetical protein
MLIRKRSLNFSFSLSLSHSVRSCLRPRLNRQGGQGELSPNPVPVKFEGIVVQVDPLAVKSVNGDVQTFIPSRQEAPAGLRADWPSSGDLVLLTYVPRARGRALTDIEIVGKTIVGTIKEIAEDDSWIVVRTQLPRSGSTR